MLYYPDYKFILSLWLYIFVSLVTFWRGKKSDHNVADTEGMRVGGHQQNKEHNIRTTIEILNIQSALHICKSSVFKQYNKHRVMCLL